MEKLFIESNPHYQLTYFLFYLHNVTKYSGMEVKTVKKKCFVMLVFHTGFKGSDHTLSLFLQ